MTRTIAIAASVVLCTSAAHAQLRVAEPSVWAQAAAPAKRAEIDTLIQVDLWQNEYRHLRQTPSALRASLVMSRARRLLEHSGAATSSDPLVRYRVAMAYYGIFKVERERELLELAMPHFEHVAASDAPAALRADALSSLAICHARLGQHELEIAAYDRAVMIEPDPESRAVLLANQAEGYMATGHISRAVRGYRASLAQTAGALMFETGVTTIWGLGVALDRSGDLDGALEQLTLARSYDRLDRALNPPGWFYVPAHDRHWYEALGHWQIARSATTRDVRLGSYAESARQWRAYIDAAPPDDVWLQLALTRLRQAEAERKRSLRKP